MVTGTISSVFLLAGGTIALIEFTRQVFDPNSFLSQIDNSLSSLVEFFTSVRDFFYGVVEIFPTPFATLIQCFLLIMFTLFLWKLVKGGS